MGQASSGSGVGPDDASLVDTFLKSGPGQNTVLAAVVTIAGQVAAQSGLPAPYPAPVAGGFALLVAVYNVRTVQKVRGANCFVLVPIVALIAFASGFGANGLVGAAKPGGNVAQSELNSLVGVQKQEIESLERQLQVQAEENNILRKLSGLPAPVPGPRGHLDDNGLAPRVSGFLGRFLDAVVPSAQAQPAPPPLSATERERLLQELREKQDKQKALAAEAERLRKERENAEKSAQQPLLWRKW